VRPPLRQKCDYRIQHSEAAGAGRGSLRDGRVATRLLCTRCSCDMNAAPRWPLRSHSGSAALLVLCTLVVTFTLRRQAVSAGLHRTMTIMRCMYCNLKGRRNGPSGPQPNVAPSYRGFEIHVMPRSCLLLLLLLLPLPPVLVPVLEPVVVMIPVATVAHVEQEQEQERVQVQVPSSQPCKCRRRR
jgi:hypothetical protein